MGTRWTVRICPKCKQGQLSQHQNCPICAPPYKPKRRKAGVGARNCVWDRYMRAARARKFEWRLSKDQFNFLTAQPCHYCGLPPSMVCERKTGDFIYSGIDRKNPNRGYLWDNVVSCCKICNRAKGIFPYREFLDWLDRFRIAK